MIVTQGNLNNSYCTSCDRTTQDGVTVSVWGTVRSGAQAVDPNVRSAYRKHVCVEFFLCKECIPQFEHKELI